MPLLPSTGLVFVCGAWASLLQTFNKMEQYIYIHNGTFCNDVLSVSVLSDREATEHVQCGKGSEGTKLKFEYK